MRKKLKKKLGRPRRKPGTISFCNFQRAVMAMNLYEEVRKNGQKHSVAIAQAVELIKQRDPAMRISETEVKRILAGWRPRGRRIFLRIECAMLSEEELAKLPTTTDLIHPKSVTIFRMSIGERPNYPRTNRKSPND
jgi:hypothetical protein